MVTPQYCSFVSSLFVSFYSMPLMYSDSFQDDEELCRILTAIRLGDSSPVPAVTPSLAASNSSLSCRCEQSSDQSSASAVTRFATTSTSPVSCGHDQLVDLSPADGPSSITPKLLISPRPPQSQVPIADRIASVNLPISPAPIQRAPIQQDRVYNVYSGKWVGLRDTW